MSLKQTYISLICVFLAATASLCNKNTGPISENVRVARLAATAGLSIRTASQITVTLAPGAGQAAGQKAALRATAEALLIVEMDLISGQFDKTKTLDRLRASILTLKSLSSAGFVGPGDALSKQRFADWLDTGILITEEIARVIELRKQPGEAPDNASLRSDAQDREKGPGTTSQITVILSSAATRYFTYRTMTDAKALHEAAVKELQGAISALST